jgi:hypothetical protein
VVGTAKLLSLLDAVRIMLPPDLSFPREGFAFNMAAEAYLTARKHLTPGCYLPKGRQGDKAHDRALIRMLSIKVSAVVSARAFLEAHPA